MRKIIDARKFYPINQDTLKGGRMNEKEIIKKIKLYEIDLEFCKEAGYKILAKDIEAKVKELNELLLRSKEITCN